MKTYIGHKFEVSSLKIKVRPYLANQGHIWQSQAKFGLMPSKYSKSDFLIFMDPWKLASNAKLKSLAWKLKSGQIWPSQAKFGQIWPHVDQNIQNLTS